jgi:hypothetical protein
MLRCKGIPACPAAPNENLQVDGDLKPRDDLKHGKSIPKAAKRRRTPKRKRSKRADVPSLTLNAARAPIQDRAIANPQITETNKTRAGAASAD